MSRSIASTATVAAIVVAMAFASGASQAAPGETVRCQSGTLEPGDGAENLVVDRTCSVGEGTYRYRNVNIVAGGTLQFADAPIDFWAASILIENDGALVAGGSGAGEPIGTKPGGRLTFHLYGKDQGPRSGKGIACVMPTCGIPNGPDSVWTSNGAKKVALPGGAVDDYFYQYAPLPSDDGDANGYFGYKVLAVSYGGTLQLFGRKGATYGAIDDSSSGTSWVRLNKTIKPDDCSGVACTLELDRPVDWSVGDVIVLTTTDYLPGHSEQLTIADISPDRTKLSLKEKVRWMHNGARFDMSVVPDRLGLRDPSGVAKKNSAETRAAVALLSRSIRIVSGGDAIDEPFPAAPAWSPDPNASPGYYFGAHTIVRQGAKKFQVQGVEFDQLGQGGRIGHYPVHFHAARRMPPDTFIKDSSVHDSMTRWFVLHSTQNVTLARNVGYLSIGHGYYLEDGTEIDNRLISNIGIFARAAIENEQNPRRIPGILAARTQNHLSRADPNAYRAEFVPFYSDYDHPAVFWIMNGWNDFEYNMAVGAGACGACYWLLPGANSGHSRHQKWEGYASLQADSSPGMNDPTARAGLSPLKKFVGNFCSTASMSFNTVANTTACVGIGAANVPNPDNPLVRAIPNPLAPDACDQSNPRHDGQFEPWACAHPNNAKADDYYPQIGGGGRFPTRCDTPNGDCSRVPPCSAGHPEGCMVTVIDNYTSSFHWSEQNFAAIWLRPQWYLYSNSVLTDVINGGLTFVTGGGYTASDVIPGHWALAYKSVFIGETQPGNPYASIASPVNPNGGLACDAPTSGNHCLIAKEGVSFPKGNFGVNARLFNIYDGPAYQDSNAYLNIRTATLDCTPGATEGSLSNCGSSKYLQGPSTGVPRDGNRCYLPNAAIGWKQPNGFYYPPAFHSDNLFFDNVEIRHYVTQPLFLPGTYQTDTRAAWQQYCNFQSDMFNNWTDIDRQTELNDDDGSLTGYAQTISINEDAYFDGPKEAIECASDETAKTSPYDYVTAVVYPQCLLPGNACPQVKPAYDSNPNARVPSWNKDCGGPFCYGVPLYRQLMTGIERTHVPAPPVVRMAGQGTGQRSTLAANNGVYYMDTTVSAERQSAPSVIPRTSLNVFQPGGVYYTFLVFAKPSTTQTYQLYVGKSGFDKATDVWPIRADIATDPPVYKKAPLPSGQLLPAGWSVDYDQTTGVLQVTMSMALDDFRLPWQAARVDKCQPSSFCAYDTKANACGCAVDANGRKLDPLCQDAVCSWAGNDPECPNGGCWGFAFKLPASFNTDPSPDPRPAPACFPRNAAWDVPWQAVSPDIAGKAPICAAAPVKPADFCDAPGAVRNAVTK